MAYEQASSSTFYQSNTGGSDLVAGSGDFNFGYGQNLGNVAEQSYSSYGSTSAADFGSGGAVLDGGAANSSAEYYSSSSYENSGAAGFEGQGVADLSASAGGLSASSSSYEQQSVASGTATYATDSQGLYQDPNPEVIRRPAPAGTQTYTQRVIVRFLQPPAVPPPGPLIIKEVRPPQPPPPPPLYIRQRPPPAPQLPPLVIREAPPKLPPAVGTQVITKMLPPVPVPPRSVIIERLPPLPPKPRDVIVERWLPYRAQQKRRVIIQRAPPPPVQKPRNIIIYYEAPKAQVVRRFQNLGIQRADPSEYLARYGTQLEDSQSLITHARQAGVVEDISPPGGVASNFQSSSFESYQTASSDAGAASFDLGSSSTGAYDFNGSYSAGGNAGFDLVGGSGLAAGAGNSTSGDYQSYSPYSSSSSTGENAAGFGQGFETSFGNLELADNLNAGGVTSGSTYESYSSQQTFSQ